MITFLRLRDMPLDFKKMIEFVLEKKPETTLEQLKELIEEKKRRIGAGYLTDQGALFLVAADLGISFENTPQSQVGIKDLYVGARDINLSVRILSIYPIRKYTRKDSEDQIENRTLTVFDQDGGIRVKLWNKLAHGPDELRLKPGDLVRITNGYIKSGLDGKPVVNLGESSNIELESENRESIPDLESIKLDVDKVTTEQEHIVIDGVIKSAPRIVEFSDPRGEVKKSLQTILSNGDSTRNLRVAIWNVSENNIPRILNVNSRVRIIGARIKQANLQYGNGDLEIHGDEGTVIEAIDKQANYDVITVRIISNGNADNFGRINLFGIDKDKNILTMVVDDKLMPPGITTNSVIEGFPSRVFGNSLIFSQKDSYVKCVENNSIPKLEDTISKIRNMDKVGDIYIVEAIVLQQPNSVQVNTRTGGLVSVTDTLIGDDTGEIRLVGWRENSGELDKIKVGDRIRVIGAILNAGRDGKHELTLKKDSLVVAMS
jgi:ssDNA-binding replication factor A large subunit